MTEAVKLCDVRQHQAKVKFQTHIFKTGTFNWDKYWCDLLSFYENGAERRKSAVFEQEHLTFSLSSAWHWSFVKTSLKSSSCGNCREWPSLSVWEDLSKQKRFRCKVRVCGRWTSFMLCKAKNNAIKNWGANPGEAGWKQPLSPSKQPVLQWIFANSTGQADAKPL